ncbi:UNVERIFIED_CONTAM: Auxin-responsive protein SAUR41, partial [Sesamum latifolium]
GVGAADPIGVVQEEVRRRSRGHLPVYVGEEMERFVVSAELLNHPIFVKLLNKSAQEYGYEQKGVLRIPCHVFLFERVLETLRIGGEARDLQEILNSLCDEL